MKAMSGEYSEIEWKKSDGMNETSKVNSFALNETEWKILLKKINIEKLGITR